MIYSQRLLVYAAIIALAAACGKKNSDSTDKTDEPGAESATAAQPEIYLEGMYATSTRIPKQQYALNNAFDGNAKTYWSTIPGAGPDEGFVLYFVNRQYISQVQLTSAQGDGLAEIKTVWVYADGQKLGDFNPANPIKIDQELASLFIKIGETGNSTTENVSSEDAEQSQELERFDTGVAIGISEIKISNADGELKVLPPVAVTGVVTASSVLQPASAYSPQQLFDSRKEFVWAEGSKGSGENEKLTFSFNEPQKITSIKIWNGYQRSDKHFESNARVKTFEFGLQDGSKVKYTLPDAADAQMVKLNEPLTGKGFELTIVEVYPGKNYKDLVISELLLFNESTPIVVADDQTETAMKSLIAETKGTVLESYLDRRLYNRTTDYSSTSTKSLILRSNKTFVIYDHTTSGDGERQEEKEVVADGNWELIEQKGDNAKIRIFGKLFNLSETVEFYQGNTSTEVIKIFQDNLYVTSDEIRGEKIIDAFYNKLPDAL